MFTIEELKNILTLIGLAPISGKDAMQVAMLQQKIVKLLQGEPQKEETPIKDKKVTSETTKV
jgi:hypothetical protein